MIDNSKILNSYDLNTSISLDLLEKTTGISKEVIQNELGIFTDEINFSDFKKKVQNLTRETFNQ